MPFANSNGTQIYYELHGEGPAVVFVHGSGGHHAAWWQQVPYFRKSYSVVTLDLRGFGSSTSEGKEWDTLDFPGDILSVLEDAGIDRAVIVGQSIGAVAALRLAFAHPERVAGIVLAHSLGGIEHPELAALAEADRTEAQKLPVLDRLMSKPFQEFQPELTFLFRQMGTLNTAKLADLRNGSAGGPTVEAVAELGVPICFLTGENDAVMRASTVRRAHELVEGSLLEVVPGAAHSMYWELPELFNGSVERFLQTIYAPTPAA